MLICTPRAFNASVNSSLVNWLPWSVLKISGCPCLLKASSSASTQNEASMLIDTRCASTRRLAQSTIAHR
jgi:hypothetical protein